VCPSCTKPTIIKGKEEFGGGWICFAKKGGCGQKFPAGAVEIEGQQTGRVQNPDVADTINTVLKMAKKRAHVDAAIALARCSDMFTQDVEDFDAGQSIESGAVKPQSTPGQKLERMAESADELAGIKRAMLEDIASDLFLSHKTDLHAQIKKAIVRLTKPDQDDVWAAWVKRRDSLIDPAKSAAQVSNITAGLAVSSTPADFDALLRLLEDNQEKIRSTDIKAAKAKIMEARNAPPQAGNHPNPLTDKMAGGDEID